MMGPSNYNGAEKVLLPNDFIAVLTNAYYVFVVMLV